MSITNNIIKVTYNVDDGLGYDYRKKREIVIADAPTLQVSSEYHHLTIHVLDMKALTPG